MGTYRSVSRKGDTLSHSLRKSDLEPVVFKYVFQEEDPCYCSGAKLGLPVVI